jgi:hypothetical protein
LFANLNGVKTDDDDLFKQICFQQLAQYDSAF